MTVVGRRLAIIPPLVAVLLVALGGAAAAEEPWVNSPAGPIAREIQPLYWFLFFFAIVVLAIVDGGLIYAGIKFRERPGHTAKQFHGHNMLELSWTVIPTIMVIGFSVLSFQRLLYINDVNTDAAMTIKAEGRQWAWVVTYPDEAMFQTARSGPLQVGEEVNIPVGTKVRIELTASDVIHSFFVPRLGGKMDAVPGRTTYMWIQADRPGTYKGQCAEFCGDGHADMLIVVVAHPREEYAAWAQREIEDFDRKDSDEARRGRELFMAGACAGCHRIQGTPAVGRIAPELTAIAAKQNIAGVLTPVNEENLTNWIRNPPAVKPGTLMPALPLSDADIADIVQYLLTLDGS